MEGAVSEEHLELRGNNGITTLTEQGAMMARHMRG
jgi:hypothetical protein